MTYNEIHVLIWGIWSFWNMRFILKDSLKNLGQHVKRAYSSFFKASLLFSSYTAEKGWEIIEFDVLCSEKKL